MIAVGDDWQSIYAFSGSDITLFTHFCDIMGYGKELKITKTYRKSLLKSGRLFSVLIDYQVVVKNGGLYVLALFLCIFVPENSDRI